MKPLRPARRTRFWAALSLAALTALLGMLTLVVPDWLEAFGIDPDHHDGTLEALLVSGLFVLSGGFAVSARIAWRRLISAPQSTR
jgi:hypothetical protein